MQPTTKRIFDPPAELTTTVSSLHIAKADLHRIRQNGWVLPHQQTAERIWLSLQCTVTPIDFAHGLREQGFTPAFTDLVRWAIDDGKCWLLIDENAELNDRLLIFVG